MLRHTLGLTWLVVGVAGYWLMVLGLLALATPAPARAGRAQSFAVIPGGVMYVYAPPLREWPIPIDRATFDDYQRAVRESDEGAITDGISRPGWVPVADRERVHVVTVDGAAVQVEILGGQHAGERGWLLARQLVPQ
jgi:hypothetical protein